MANLDLADLDAFTAVARHRGFRGAASVRGVSASSLSEAVRRLEGRLGVRLLNRTTRSVTPTEAGARLMERLVPALREVEEAMDVVNGFRDSPAGTLRLNVPSIVAMTILPPIVTAFLTAHPAIVLEVVSQDASIDVLAAGFDAGVRYDERLEQDMIAIPLGPRMQKSATAASPAYLAAHGRPRHPRDLLQHACIRHRFLSGASPGWEFTRNGELVRIAASGPLVANSTDLELAVAIAGLGVVHSFEAFLAPAVEAGALEWVLEDWDDAFPGPYLYYPSRRHMPAPLRAFVDFVKAWGEGGPAPSAAGA